MQGRVLYDVFLYTQPSGGFLIEYDSRQSVDSPPLLQILKRYVLRSKVKLRDVSSEYDVWAVWGSEETEPARTWNWSRSGCVEPSWGGQEWPWGVEHGVIRDRRGVGMGKRLLVLKGDIRECSCFTTC
jgi:transferase CAF17, mitochondrial